MTRISFLVIMLLLIQAACKKEKPREIDSSYVPDILLGNFTNSTNITNPYFPITPGKKFIYEGQTPDGLEQVVEQRLDSTKTILGIACVIVNVKEYLNGKLTEETWDWYAQDNDGTVWYFGEAVNKYNPDGSLQDHDGAWEAGIYGSQPGIIMPAIPKT